MLLVLPILALRTVYRLELWATQGGEKNLGKYKSKVRRGKNCSETAN